MQNSNQITKLYVILSNIGPDISKQKRLKQFETQLSHKPDLAYEIVSHFTKCFSEEQINVEKLRQIIFVSQRLACINKYQSMFTNTNLNHVNNMGKYIKKQTNSQSLQIIITLIGRLCTNANLTIYSHSQQLFKSSLQKFIQIDSQKTQQLLATLLVDILLINPKFINISNDPYYFLEFWLHSINQEPSLQKKLYWVKAINTLYKNPEAIDGLFYESDFRTLADILLRILSECPNNSTIRIPLQCYITLFESGKIKKAEKLEDFQDFIGCLDIEALGIKDLADKIYSFK